MGNDVKTNKSLIDAIINNVYNVKELISRATLEELNAECSVDDRLPILIAAKYNPKLIVDIINAGAYSGMFAGGKHFIKTLHQYNKNYIPQLIQDCVDNDCSNSKIEEIIIFLSTYNYLDTEGVLGKNVLMTAFDAKPFLMSYCLTYNTDPFLKTSSGNSFFDELQPYIDNPIIENSIHKSTILHYCAAAGLSENNKKFILKLIESGLDINQQDNQGNSVLHWAADFSDFNMVKFLIENGADPFLLNNNKENIMHKMASKSFSQTNYEYFLNLGCNPNQENAKGRNIFDIALEYSIANLQLLIDCEKIKDFIDKYTLIEMDNMLGQCFKNDSVSFLEDEGINNLKMILQKHTLEQKAQIKKNKINKVL